MEMAAEIVKKCGDGKPTLYEREGYIELEARIRAEAAKLPDGDARDAARFRFIYETENWNPCQYDKTVGWYPVNHFTIDAAMQPAKE
jgi:hypothetical protein